ncbi:MAG: hypothetical protein AB7Y46_19025, partial [Armatimonadota bacterium]
MAEKHESAQRRAARMKMREALALFQGRHPERGVEAMKEVLELDPDFIEPRKWLADYYLRTGKERLAISQYETMLRIEPDNEQLWEGLRAIDPNVAEKLQRLQHVAPDPFAAASARVDTSDLDDFEDEEAVEETREGPAPFLADRRDTGDLVEDEDAIEAAPYQALPWDHEQDAEMRAALESNPAFVDVMDGLELFWRDARTWSRLLVPAVPPCNAHWDVLDPLLSTVADILDGPMPLSLVLSQHTPWPLCLPLQEPTLVLGETYRDFFSQQELLFVLGFCMHLFMNQNAQFAWAADHVVQRKGAMSGLREKIIETAKDFTVGWDERLPREEVVRLSKIAHAYEQRAVLSADRAGLLACPDLEAACRAIGIMVTDPFKAARLTPDNFLERFQHIPAAELPAIGLSRSPWTDEQYAA